MESFRSKLHEVLPFSPVSLTKSCSFWYGLKDLFTTWPLQLMTSQSVEGTRIFPSGGGGGTSDFNWQGRSNGAKYQNPEKSHAEFLSLKNLQKGKQIWMYFNRKTTLSGYAGTIMFWIAKKIPAQIRLPKKIIAKFYYLKISRNRKFQTLSLWLEIQSTPLRDSYGWFRVVQGVKTMLKLDRQTCSCQ